MEMAARCMSDPDAMAQQLKLFANRICNTDESRKDAKDDQNIEDVSFYNCH